MFKSQVSIGAGLWIGRDWIIVARPTRVFQCRDGPVAACRDSWEKLNYKFSRRNNELSKRPEAGNFSWRSVKQVEIWFSNYVFDIYFSGRIIVHHHFKFKSFNKKFGKINLCEIKNIQKQWFYPSLYPGAPKYLLGPD